MKLFKSFLAIILSFALSITTGIIMVSADNEDFLKSVLIECGRGAYTTGQIEAIINKMSECGYNCLMLGFGNDGLRFILDDLSVTVNDKIYDSNTIKNSVIASNDRIAPDDKGQFTQTEMDEILSLADSKNIEIIPMLDIPGHATAITDAMAVCGIENSAFIVDTGNNAAVVVNNLSVNIENEEAKAFTKALTLKYVDYFADRGCRYFNLGCDEYGGSADYLNDATVSKIRDFIADICDSFPKDVTPMAFTDVLSKADSCPDEIIGINWNGGNLNGHKMMNANDNWYYVLSYTGNGWSAYDKALKNTKEIPVNQMINGQSEPIGSILAIWNDKYIAADDYMDNIFSLIENQAANNPDYFCVGNSANDENRCDLCGKIHSENILGRIVGFLHNVFYRFKILYEMSKDIFTEAAR